MKVLVTGSGHARRDRGVPFYLRAAQVPGEAVLSLAFLEVTEDGRDADAYRQRWDQGLPFDYVWFTPRFDRDDPCELLKARMGHSS